MNKPETPIATAIGEISNLKNEATLEISCKAENW